MCVSYTAKQYARIQEELRAQQEARLRELVENEAARQRAAQEIERAAIVADQEVEMSTEETMITV
jgi:hypothetical protein